jgi:hypothetical protein
MFGERNSERRKLVISELYTENCTFSDFDSDDQSVGRDALNTKVEQLLAGAPGFVFRLAAPALVIRGLGRVRWHFGPAGAELRIFEGPRPGRSALNARERSSCEKFYTASP